MDTAHIVAVLIVPVVVHHESGVLRVLCQCESGSGASLGVPSQAGV